MLKFIRAKSLSVFIENSLTKKLIICIKVKNRHSVEMNFAYNKKSR